MTEGTDHWKTLGSRMSDYNALKVHDRLSSDRVAGTTEWFVKHPTFKAWCSSEPKNIGKTSLWCTGDGRTSSP